MTRTHFWHVAVWAILLASAAAGRAEVTSLQNDVAPTKDYAGCRDTWISNEDWERNHIYGQRVSLHCGGKRHILMRFDLSPIPQGETIHKAVLRLSETGFPRRGRDGKYPAAMKAYALTRAWNDNANWMEHTRTDWNKQDEGDWKSAGGDHDTTTDFGQAEKGLIGTDRIVDGRWGHVHELDITEVVRRWHGGTLANHGLLLAGGGAIASAEWPVPAYRPRLIVDHGRQAKGIPPLSPAPKEIALDPIAATPDGGAAADRHEPVRVGQNANCVFRGKSTSVYVKENVAQFPGTWGWMAQCRVGGVAGDFNRTLLYFDLGQIPKSASIKQARLVCTLVRQTSRNVRQYRYGVFLVKLPGEPGCSEEATATEAAPGRPWPDGGLLACSEGNPLALGKVTRKEIEERGQKRTVDWGIEFDVTGAVRAWVAGKAPNCGLVLDNRIEGGAYDIYGSRSWYPDRRPYLEILMSPGPNMVPAPMKVELAPPPGDYWVEPMKRVHARFKGKPGTLAQYGDSITVTYAFLAYRFAKGAPKDITPPREELALPDTSPEVKKELQVVADHSDRTLWWKWKGGEWGNTGMMMSDWLFNNIDGWQKKMNPETSVVMFGTNDRGRIVPPVYTEYMAASVQRMLADGTVPILTTIPPPADDSYRLAILAIARGLKVPVIDYNAEIYRRRGDDWSGKKNPPGLISEDGTHPSHPGKYLFSFSEEALNNNGYLLRDYMTIRMYARIISKVYRAKDD